MAETSISWTHTVARDGRPVAGYTFNPWIGCQKVSPACDGCYAEHLMSTRLGRVEWGPHGERQRTSPGYWHQPIRWERKAIAEGTRPFVFCASLADVFDNRARTPWRMDLFGLIRETPHLVWLLLTKRPQNIVDMVDDAGGLPHNVALGTTAEDQQRWDQNIPALACAKAKTSPLFAFVSIEPMLGRINPRRAPVTVDMRRHFGWASGTATEWDPIHPQQDRRFKLDWLITGGETDQGAHKARQTHPDLFREIRDPCEETGTLYHHKQNGEWLFMGQSGFIGWTAANRTPDQQAKKWLGHAHLKEPGSIAYVTGPVQTMAVLGVRTRTVDMCVKIGAKHSGRLLDGREHVAVPQVAS